MTKSKETEREREIDCVCVCVCVYTVSEPTQWLLDIKSLTIKIGHCEVDTIFMLHMTKVKKQCVCVCVYTMSKPMPIASIPSKNTLSNNWFDLTCDTRLV